MIGMKKLQLFTQLHLSEQSWLKTAEHCSIYLLSKVATRVLFSIFIISYRFFVPPFCSGWRFSFLLYVF